MATSSLPGTSHKTKTKSLLSIDPIAEQSKKQKVTSNGDDIKEKKIVENKLVQDTTNDDGSHFKTCMTIAMRARATLERRTGTPKAYLYNYNFNSGKEGVIIIAHGIFSVIEEKGRTDMMDLYIQEAYHRCAYKWEEAGDDSIKKRIIIDEGIQFMCDNFFPDDYHELPLILPKHLQLIRK